MQEEIQRRQIPQELDKQNSEERLTLKATEHQLVLSIYYLKANQFTNKRLSIISFYTHP